MRRLGWIGFVLLAVLAAAACGSDEAAVGTADGAGEPTTTVRSPDQRYRFVGHVLEGPDHGPHLCFGIEDSYPPQCGGPEAVGWGWADVVGWDWSAVEHESANDTRWGNYALVGTWDDGVFTLSGPAAAHTPSSSRTVGGPEPLPLPCDDPPVGTIATDTDAVDPAFDYVGAQDDWAGSWHVGDVYVVAFTGDRERHERELATRWDGKYCVTSSPRTYAEQERMMIELAREFEALISAMAHDRGGVDLTLWVDDPEVQSELDRRYGAGVVVVDGYLEPVDD